MLVRTQIQLTEEQMTSLKKLAAQRSVSLAELIRQGVGQLLAEVERREKRERALALLGRYDAGPTDVSRHHDRYLGDDYR